MNSGDIDAEVTMPGGAQSVPLGRSDAGGNGFDAKSVSDAVTMVPGGGLSLGRIDQYELVRELGGGGFGSVYLAKDTVAGIEVAVKGLSPIIKNNAEELERIRENFALVSRLHHPYIAAALVLHPAKEVSYSSEDVRQKLRVVPGDTLMVMEYAPGVTLSKWRRQFPNGKVPLEPAIQIAWQVAQALDYAHEHHIIHRDIKPANIMVETRPDGEVVARLLDFGLAAEVRSSMGRVSREIHDTSGTRPYMAPEQWTGRKQGPATDQYALAVLLYEMLTGEVPFASVFDTGDPMVMMNAVCSQEVEFPEDCPRKEALRRALEKDPSQRFASCVNFLEAAAKSESMKACNVEDGRRSSSLKVRLRAERFLKVAHSHPKIVITCVSIVLLFFACVLFCDFDFDHVSQTDISFILEGQDAIVCGKDQWSSAISEETRGPVKVPSKIGGARVTKIGQRAFINCTYVSSIVIPKSVEVIEEYAFSGCSSLTSIVIPDGVKTIGDYAFSDCAGLASIQIPRSATSIGENAFADCPALVAVSLPDGVTSIGADAFSGCSGLRSVRLPSKLSDIPSRMFNGCAKLGPVTFPDSLRRIGYYAFSGCDSITSLDIASGVKEIGEGAFYKTGLTSVRIPKTVKKIEAEAFAGTPLSSVELEAGLTVVWDGAFKHCEALHAVKLPDALERIGERAFSGCSSLQSISIPSSVLSIGDYAFYECSGLEEVSIPDGVKTIGDYAFSDCAELMTVIVGEGVTILDESVFEGCTGLKSIVLPRNLSEIRSSAFENCSSLRSLDIPDNVKTIGRHAFRGAALNSLTLPVRFKSKISDFGIRKECKVIFKEETSKANHIQNEANTKRNRATSNKDATNQEEDLVDRPEDVENSRETYHYEYTVQSADTLDIIVKAFGSTIPKLKKLNGLKSNSLRVGQKIRIKKEWFFAKENA